MKVPFSSVAIAALTLSFVLAGCGSGSGGGSGSGNNESFGPIAGTWRATALSGGGPDTPCPTTFAVSDTSGGLRSFGCGPTDTLVFNADGTFTGTKAPLAGTTGTLVETFSGRWSQFQLRVLLTVDGVNGLVVFPYSTTINFRNANQFTVPAAGFASINRFLFTRQQ